MFTFRAACAVVVGVVLAPLLGVVGAPPASAADEGYCALTWPGQEKFVWDGGADGGPGDSLWNDPANWEGDIAPPDLLEAGTGYVCIDAAHDLDLDSDTVYMVHEDENLLPGDSSAISSMLQAIDVKSGTLSINRAGKLHLYGDQSQRPSFIREDARLELTMGTLGGDGLLNLDGDMEWTSTQRGSTTLKSSCRGIAGDNPGDPVGTPDVPPPFCPLPDDVESPMGSGQLVVNGSLTIRGGILQPDGDLVDDVLARGVNLSQRYRLVVGNGGEVHVAGDAYVAQSHTASIEVQNGGEWIFDGDGDVVEGSFEGTPSGPLPPFVNEGAVVKASGAGGSTIDTAYDGYGAVVVNEGALTTPGGFPDDVAVGSGDSLGSWDCPQLQGGTLEPDCVFDDVEDAPVTSSQDRQAAQLTLPDFAGRASVQVVEADVAGPRDLQPPVRVDVTGLPVTDVSELAFEFSNRITDLPDKPRIRIYRRAGGANWRDVPRCNEGPGSPFPNGVSACIQGARDRTGGDPDEGAVRVTVLTFEPAGSWVLRTDRRIVTPRDNGSFGTDSAADTGVGPLLLPATSDADHCAASGPVQWELMRELVGKPADDHAIGWKPSSPGRARGFQVPVTDLADLQAFALRLRVLRGDLQGYVHVVRHESASTSWIADARVLQSDTIEVAGNWRLANGGDVIYTWRRHTNGTPDGAEFVGTIADFVSQHADKAAGTDPDRIGFAFGCAGERALLNDLTVQMADGADPIVWDLEVQQAYVEFAENDEDIGDRCQISSRMWPNVVTRRMKATPGAVWDLTWRPADPTKPWRLLKPAVMGRGGGRHDIELPAQKGLVQAVVRRSDDYRVDGSTVLRFKAVPRIDLRTITRSQGVKVLRVGHRIVLKGGFAPGGTGEVRLWVMLPGADALRPTGSVGRIRKGRFSLGYRPDRPGRHAFAVAYDGSEQLNGAISGRVFFTKVAKKLPPEQPEPPLPPPPTVPPDEDTGSTNSGIERSVLSRQGSCVYRVGR